MGGREGACLAVPGASHNGPCTCYIAQLWVVIVAFSTQDFLGCWERLVFGRRGQGSGSHQEQGGVPGGRLVSVQMQRLCSYLPALLSGDTCHLREGRIWEQRPGWDVRALKVEPCPGGETLSLPLASNIFSL